MKHTFLALLLPCLLLTACGDDVGAAPKGLGDKVAGVLGEQAKQLQGSMSGLVATLKGIKDGATATSAKAKLEEIVGKLQGAAGAGITKLLGESSSLKDGVMTQLNRLLDNADVKKAIGPVLEKLQGMLTK